MMGVQPKSGERATAGRLDCILGVCAGGGAAFWWADEDEDDDDGADGAEGSKRFGLPSLPPAVPATVQPRTIIILRPFTSLIMLSVTFRMDNSLIVLFSTNEFICVANMAFIK